MKNTNSSTGAQQFVSEISKGFLMNPSDVQEALGTGSDPSSVRWTLFGDVSAATLARFRGHGFQPGISELVRIARSPAGFRYLVVVHQVGSRQHRWLMATFEPAVRQCLSDLAAGRPLGVALGGHRQQSHVWRSQLSAEKARSMLCYCETVSPQASLAALADFAMATAELSRPDAVDSLQQGVAVAAVSVTVMRPEVTIAHIERAAHPQH